MKILFITKYIFYEIFILFAVIIVIQLIIIFQLIKVFHFSMLSKWKNAASIYKLSCVPSSLATIRQPRYSLYLQQTLKTTLLFWSAHDYDVSGISNYKILDMVDLHIIKKCITYKTVLSNWIWESWYVLNEPRPENVVKIL